MQKMRIYLREAEEAPIQPNLAKAMVTEEYNKKVKLVKGPKNLQKAEALARLALKEKKAVSNMVVLPKKALWRVQQKKKGWTGKN